MLERVYLDNIRSFVNFEWRPGPLAVILGANGSGKTALFSILAGVQRLIARDASTEETFPPDSRTRWDTRVEQTVELDLRTPSGLCRYRLVVEHDARSPGFNRIREESVHLDGRPLIELSAGQVQLYPGDDGSRGARFPAKPTRSGVGAVSPLPEWSSFFEFKEGMARLWFLRPDARRMGARVAGLTPARGGRLDEDVANFADWYLRMLTEKPGTVFKALRDLAGAVPGLEELHERAGWLHARFELEGVTQSFRFDELSDGQRALVALYVLRHVVGVQGRLLAIDEPDNYVALPEIQPWLLQVERAALKPGGPQVWLISHHPEVLNLLAVDHGWRFFRDGLGPSRVERFQPAAGLDAAETVARGWDGEPNG